MARTSRRRIAEPTASWPAITSSATSSAWKALRPSCSRRAKCSRATPRPDSSRNISRPERCEAAALGLEQLALVRDAFPLFGVGRRGLLLGDHRPLLGELRVELLVIFLTRG